MRDREEAILHLISEAEVALAKARAEISYARLERAVTRFTPPVEPQDAPELATFTPPDPDLQDEPPSRPA